MSEQESTLVGTISIAGERGPVGPAGGVNTFNSRKGDVLPQKGDYNYEMVNAMPATEVLTNADILNIWANA